VTINFTIKNQGATFTSPSRFYIGAYLSTDNLITTGDLYCGRFQMTAMRSGTSYSSSITCSVGTAIKAGTYYVGVYADYMNGIVESNESNNGLAASSTLLVK
jgi:subtilase family serine protease